MQRPDPSPDSVYLDYAATSAVRPAEVAEAVGTFLAGTGATPGRGAYRPAVEAGRTALACRRALLGLLGLPGSPDRVVFTLNATHALNVALWGTLGPGDAVVVTPFDHNAVLRPVHRLAAERGVTVRTIPGSPDGSLDLDAAEALLAGARLLVVNEVSNVLGTRLPVAELAGRAKAAGALVLVDTAQSAGHLPTRPADAGADLVALTGHKGLLGPQGIGALWIREGVEVAAHLAGGSGGSSLSREMPAALPDRLEAGTVNAPGIVGLEAGLRFLASRGVEDVHGHVAALKARLHEGLSSIEGLEVLTPPAPDGAGIVTVRPRGTDPGTLADRLDRDHGVCVRAGLHCAPEVHRLLGTAGTGAVRLSLGWASTADDVDLAVRGVEAVLGSPAVSVAPAG